MNRLSTAVGGLLLASTVVLGACTPAEMSNLPTAGDSSSVPSTSDAPWDERSADWIAELNPCEEEDGPGPCIWEADQVGNGVGYSFWIDCAQFTHYFDPRAQREMEARGINEPGGENYDNTCRSAQ